MRSVSGQVDMGGFKEQKVTFGLGEDGVPVGLTIRWPGRVRLVQNIRLLPLWGLTEAESSSLAIRASHIALRKPWQRAVLEVVESSSKIRRL